jgi:hypothetical protein
MYRWLHAPQLALSWFGVTSAVFVLGLISLTVLAAKKPAYSWRCLVVMLSLVIFVNALPFWMNFDSDMVDVAHILLIYAAVATAIPCNLLFLILTRSVLERARRLDGAVNVACLIGFNVITAVLFVIIPLLLAVYFGTVDEHRLVTFLDHVGRLNLLGVLTASVFVILAMALLVHRVLWTTVLDRPVYMLQKMGITRRRKTLGILGTGLLVLAFFGTSEFSSRL